MVPIIPGGNSIPLTFSNRKEYVARAIEYRLHEIDRQVVWYQRFQIMKGPYDSLPTSQTCFFQLRLPPYSSQMVMAERLRYAINNCRSIDLDNYMLSRNVDNAEGSDTDY